MAVSRRHFLKKSLASGLIVGSAGCGSSSTGDGPSGPDGGPQITIGTDAAIRADRSLNPDASLGIDASASADSSPGTDVSLNPDRSASADKGAAPSDTAADVVSDAKLATRILGRTEARVSILGFGTAPLGSDNTTPDMVTKLVNAAIDLGITYLDTAPNYGTPGSRYGTSEMKLKEVLRTRRKEVFLVTKIEPAGPTRDGVLRQIETALRAMGVDQIDLVHIHSLGDWNVAGIMAPTGTIAGLLEAKKRGLIRFAGTSGHNGIAKFAPVIDTGEIDATMNTLNFADRSNPQYNFEDVVLPVARKHNTGIVAMKVLGGGVNWSYDGKTAGNFATHLERSIRYSLGIANLSTAVIGFSNENEIKQAVAIARGYQPLGMMDKMMLLEQGRALARGRTDFYG